MKNHLVIDNLFAQTLDGKEILKGISLKINQGETHAIMGPNGGGKSTLALVLMGHPGYKITKGEIFINEQKINKLSTDKRAKLGLFLGFQYPVEIPGVNFSNFLRMAINEDKTKENLVSPIQFKNMLIEKAKQLSITEDLPRRMLNEGFSGGEKKKAEILQLSLLKPKFAVLDEPDSGLDVDALKYIAKAINALSFPMGLVLITHYQRILHYIKPDFVHILLNGTIIKSGGATLAKQIEKTGYESFQK